jgi:hypothetical protein
VHCRNCKSNRLRPSPPAGRAEALLRAATRTRYQVCKECGTRARYPRAGRGGRPRLEPAFLLAALAVLAAYLVLVGLLR